MSEDWEDCGGTCGHFDCPYYQAAIKESKLMYKIVMPILLVLSTAISIFLYIVSVTLQDRLDEALGAMQVWKEMDIQDCRELLKGE